MHRRIWESLRYSSTLPTRGVLAVAAALRSITFVMATPALGSDPIYASLFAAAAAQVWSAMFAMIAIAITWRIFEPRSRVAISRVINAATCGIWVVYIASMFSARGFLAPDCAADVAALLAAIWCTLRTDLTVDDRGTA